MLLDANLLLYAVHKQSEQHRAAAEWLTEQLNGSRRVGLPWQTLGAFLRIATHPRAFERPLSPATAWERVSDWLSAPVAWIPLPGHEHARIVGALVTTYDVRGNLVPDAFLAALAIEHGLTLYSADTDFARFPELRWQNPIR
jgi:toxin-antitoxin system PIN domain toxin